jgi:hypothetical protein
VRRGSLPSSGPGAGTFQTTAGSAALDGFGPKNQSPGLFPTTEHVSLAACVPHVPSAAATDRCAAVPPLTGGMPEQNGRWKALPERPVHRGASFHRDAFQYTRKRGVSRLLKLLEILCCLDPAAECEQKTDHSLFSELSVGFEPNGKAGSPFLRRWRYWR